jgi:hypothetical protein
MNKALSNTFHLKGWMAIPVNSGIVLKYEGQGQVRLIEIASDNDVRTLRFDDEVDLFFCERDAWLIARVIVSMLESSDEDYWEGASPLLPIYFDGFSVENLQALAALVYCYHMPQNTICCGDKEQRGYLQHVHFDGKCWSISITEELELDFIQKI